MPRITWYLKRLRVMTARELLYRIRQQWTLLSLSAKYLIDRGKVEMPPENASFQFCSGKRQLPQLTFDLESLRQEAATLFEGKVAVAGVTWEWRDSPVIWHRAPDTGRSWPRHFFGRIPYRDGNPFGDIRQLWEPSRLQHLVNLAVLGSTGNSDECQQAVSIVQRQLVSWIDSNPPLTGAHYISSMECALRIIAVCQTLDILRDKLVDSTSWEVLIRIVASHAPLIERRLSLHSSVGNHTIAEAAGLVYSGLLFPDMEGSDQWLELGLSILEDAAITQVMPDGGGAEQAPWYHLFNIQLLSLVETLLHYCGKPARTTISAAVEHGSNFLNVIGLDAGCLPPIGDSDNGYALSKYLQLPRTSDMPKQETCTFGDTGLTVAHIATAPDVELLFDHGGLGMPPSYGHGHADALSLLLRVNSKDIFVDPGTFTYTGDPIWRQYFRSTRAHNTVTVNAKDQARQDACFLWSKPFNTRLIATEMSDNLCGRMVAEHDGYLDVGVRHVRGIAWAKDQWLLVCDEIFGEGHAALELHWHMAMQPRWIDSESFELQHAGKRFSIQCEGGTPSTHTGEHSPVLGWRSLSYGSIDPIWTVKLYQRATLPHSFTTKIGLRGTSPSDDSIEDSLKWIRDRAR